MPPWSWSRRWWARCSAAPIAPVPTGSSQARMLKDTARFHARLGRLLIDARVTGRDAFRVIDDRVGWDQLERSIRFAEDLTRSADDGLEEVIERYPTVRRFAPTFLSAFTFRTARTGDPLLGAIDALRTWAVHPGRSLHRHRPPRWTIGARCWPSGASARRRLSATRCGSDCIGGRRWKVAGAATCPLTVRRHRFVPSPMA